MTNGDAGDLDAMLRGWAAATRLTDVEADTIRRAVVREPVPASSPRVTANPLAPSWWTDLSLRVSAIMVDASRAGATPFAV